MPVDGPSRPAAIAAVQPGQRGRAERLEADLADRPVSATQPSSVVVLGQVEHRRLLQQHVRAGRAARRARSAGGCAAGCRRRPRRAGSRPAARGGRGTRDARRRVRHLGARRHRPTSSTRPAACSSAMVAPVRRAVPGRPDQGDPRSVASLSGTDSRRRGGSRSRRAAGRWRRRRGVSAASQPVMAATSSVSSAQLGREDRVQRAAAPSTVRAGSPVGGQRGPDRLGQRVRQAAAAGRRRPRPGRTASTPATTSAAYRGSAPCRAPVGDRVQQALRQLLRAVHGHLQGAVVDRRVGEPGQHRRAVVDDRDTPAGGSRWAPRPRRPAGRSSSARPGRASASAIGRAAGQRARGRPSPSARR